VWRREGSDERTRGVDLGAAVGPWLWQVLLRSVRQRVLQGVVLAFSGYNLQEDLRKWVLWRQDGRPARDRGVQRTSFLLLVLVCSDIWYLVFGR